MTGPRPIPSETPHHFPQAAPHAVALDRIANLLRHGEAEAQRPVIRPFARLQHECRCGDPAAGRRRQKVRPLAMGCTMEQFKTIARGSYLHDIGKIGIPDSILLKQGKLTPEEMAIMQTHVRIGFELLSRIPFLSSASKIVLAHQERYDGAGYPQGLAGEEIPLGARIFAVADTLDAMTSDRPYRQALPFSTAREEIIRESGKQFDPDVVRVFLSLPEQTWEEIRSQVANARGRANHSGPDKEETFVREMLVN